MALTWPYSCADESGEDRRENNLFRAIKLLGEPIRTVDIYIIITAGQFIENRYGGYTLTLFGLFIFILLIYSLIFHIRTNRSSFKGTERVDLEKQLIDKGITPARSSEPLLQEQHAHARLSRTVSQTTKTRNCRLLFPRIVYGNSLIVSQREALMNHTSIIQLIQFWRVAAIHSVTPPL